jgi:hypothetical protein
VSRNTPRYVLALNGSEGCELLSKDEEKEKEEVVGNLNGNGMLLVRSLKELRLHSKCKQCRHGLST